MIVLTANLEPPVIVTDCLSISDAARCGTAKVTSPSRMLAQIWLQIATTLGADVSTMITGRHLIWMPAHGAVASIGKAVRSDGRAVTAKDWRANRFADALAKLAADGGQRCSAAQALLATAEKLVKHEAAVLAAVT